MTSSLRRALVAAGIAVVAAVGLAGPASAHATVGLDPPAVDQQPDPGATIQARVNPEARTNVTGVRLRVEQVGSNRADIQTPSVAPQGGVATFDLPFPYNGTYRATATAAWDDAGTLLVSRHSGTGTSAPVDFVVAKYPVRPADVKTAVDADSRAVTVTWKANPEPDLLFYQVQRAKGATSTDFSVLGKVTQPKYVDTTTTDSGGDYRYQVVAVRKGVAADEGLSSDPSALSTAKVPDPPPPPTTAPPAAGAAGGTGAAGTGTGTGTAGAAGTASSVPANSPGALATSGTVDLSGFNTVRNQTRSAAPRTVQLPDPGFQGTLPFDMSNPGATDDTLAEEGGDLGEQAADSPQFRELGEGSSAADRARTMASFAAGLLATVLLMHVLWVKSEVKRVPLEAVDPEGPLPVVPLAVVGQVDARPAKRRRSGRDAPIAGPTLEDTGAADFAPIVVVADNGKGKGRADRARPAGNRRQKVSTGA